MIVRRWPFAALCAPLFLLASDAWAAPSAADKAAAQGLFDQAKDAMAKNDFAHACPMLEESERLDPGEGTQFYLAKCYEGAGRVASAWTLYIDVSDAAKLAGNVDRQKVARQHADDIAKRVPRLVLAVPPGIAEVKRDGELVGQGQWSTPIPVDPGTHRVSASAPGKKPFEGSIDVREGQTATFTIPPLMDAPATASSQNGTPSAAPSSATPPPSGGLGTQQILAIGAGGVGLVGVVLGSVFGLSSKSKHDSAAPDCQGNECTADGVQLRKDAISAGNLSTAFFVIGAVGLAGGAALWLTAPTSGDSSTAVRLSPAVGPHLAGASFGGAF
jgi:hypothetical protein